MRSRPTLTLGEYLVTSLLFVVLSLLPTIEGSLTSASLWLSGTQLGWLDTGFGESLLSLLVLAVVSLLGVLLAERHTLIDKGERTLQLLFLTILWTILPPTSVIGAVGALLYPFILHLCFSAYQSQQESRTYLALGFLVGLPSLVVPPYIILFPALLVGSYYLRSSSVRHGLSLLSGLLLPAWLLGAVLLVLGEGSLSTYLSLVDSSWLMLDRGALQPFYGVPWLMYLAVGLLYLLGVVLYRGRYYRESVRHRDMFAVLQFHPLLLLLLVPWVGLSSESLLRTTLLPVSFVLARGLTALPTRLGRLLRWVLILALLALALLEHGLIQILISYIHFI